jgi:hypothetical protein
MLVTKGSDKVMGSRLLLFFLCGCSTQPVFVQPKFNEPASLFGAGDELGYDTFMDHEMMETFNVRYIYD